MNALPSIRLNSDQRTLRAQPSDAQAQQAEFTASDTPPLGRKPLQSTPQTTASKPTQLLSAWLASQESDPFGFMMRYLESALCQPNASTEALAALQQELAHLAALSPVSLETPQRSERRLRLIEASRDPNFHGFNLHRHALNFEAQALEQTKRLAVGTEDPTNQVQTRSRRTLSETSSGVALTQSPAAQLLLAHQLSDPEIWEKLRLSGDSALHFAQACVTLKSRIPLDEPILSALQQAEEKAEALADFFIRVRNRVLTAPTAGLKTWWKNVEQLLLIAPKHQDQIEQIRVIPANWTLEQQQWFISVVVTDTPNLLRWALAFSKLFGQNQLTLQHVETLRRNPLQLQALTEGLLALSKKYPDNAQPELIEALAEGLSQLTTDPAHISSPFPSIVGKKFAEQLIRLKEQCGDLVCWPLLLKEACNFPQFISALCAAVARLKAQHTADEENIFALLQYATRAHDDPYSTSFVDALLHLVPPGHGQQSLLNQDTRFALMTSRSNNPYALAVGIRSVGDRMPLSSDRAQQIILILSRLQTQKPLAASGQTPTPSLVPPSYAEQLGQWQNLTEEVTAAYVQAEGDPNRDKTITDWYNAPTSEQASRWLRLWAYPFGTRAQEYPPASERQIRLDSAYRLLNSRDIHLQKPALDWAAEALLLQPLAYQEQLLNGIQMLANGGLLKDVYNLGVLLSAPEYSAILARALRKAQRLGVDLALARNLVLISPAKARKLITIANALQAQLAPADLIKMLSSNSLKIFLNPVALEHVKALLNQLKTQPALFQQILQAIIRDPHCAQSLRTALHLFSTQLGEKAQTYQKQLLLNPEFAVPLAQGIITLERAGLLTQQRVQRLVSEAANAQTLAEGLVTLKEKGLSVDEYAGLLQKHAQQAPALAKNLAHLAAKHQLSETVRLRLQQPDAVEVSNCLSTLIAQKASTRVTRDTQAFSATKTSGFALPISLTDPFFLRQLPLHPDTADALLMLSEHNGMPPALGRLLAQTFGLGRENAAAFRQFVEHIVDQGRRQTKFPLQDLQRWLSPINVVLIKEFPALAAEIFDNRRALDDSPLSEVEKTAKIYDELKTIEHYVLQKVNALAQPLPEAASSAPGNAASNRLPQIDPALLERWSVSDTLRLPAADALQKAISGALSTAFSEKGASNTSTICLDTFTTEQKNLQFLVRNRSSESDRLSLTPAQSADPALLQTHQQIKSFQKFIARTGHFAFFQSMGMIIANHIRSAQVEPSTLQTTAIAEAQIPALLKAQIGFSYLGLSADILDEISTVTKITLRKLPNWFPSLFSAPNRSHLPSTMALSANKIVPWQHGLRLFGRAVAAIDIVLSSIQLANSTNEFESNILKTQLALGSTTLGLSLLSNGAAVAGLTVGATAIGTASAGVALLALPITLLTSHVLNKQATTLHIASYLTDLYADYSEGFGYTMRNTQDIYVDFQYHLEHKDGQLNFKSYRKQPISEIDYRRPGYLKYAVDGTSIHTMTRVTVVKKGSRVVRVDPFNVMDPNKKMPLEQWMGLTTSIERGIPNVSENTGVIETNLPDCKAATWEWKAEHVYGIRDREDAELKLVRRWNSEALRFEPSTHRTPMQAFTELIPRKTPQPTPLTVYLNSAQHILRLPENPRPITVHVNRSSWGAVLPISNTADLALIAPTGTGFGTTGSVDARFTHTDPFDPSTLHFKNNVLTVGNSTIKLEGAQPNDWISIYLPGRVRYLLHPVSGTLSLTSIELDRIESSAIPEATGGPSVTGVNLKVPSPYLAEELTEALRKGEQQAIGALKDHLTGKLLRQSAHTALDKLKEELAGRLPQTLYDRLVSQWGALTQIRVRLTIERWLQTSYGKKELQSWLNTVKARITSRYHRIDTTKVPGGYYKELVAFPEALSIEKWRDTTAGGVFNLSDPIRQLALEAPTRLPSAAEPIYMTLQQKINEIPKLLTLKYHLDTQRWAVTTAEELRKGV